VRLLRQCTIHNARFIIEGLSVQHGASGGATEAQPTEQPAARGWLRAADKESLSAKKAAEGRRAAATGGEGPQLANEFAPFAGCRPKNRVAQPAPPHSPLSTLHFQFFQKPRLTSGPAERLTYERR